MSLPTALVLLSMVIAGAMFVSRRVQPGYVDFLTPLLGLYFVHSVTRAWFDWYWPDLYRVNAIVQLSGESGIVDALLLTTACLAVLTVAPETRGARVRPAVVGGAFGRDGFSFAWPIWREPATLQTIRALLSHPDARKPGALPHLGVDHVLVARRISVGKFMNFTRARPIVAQ